MSSIFAYDKPSMYGYSFTERPGICVYFWHHLLKNWYKKEGVFQPSLSTYDIFIYTYLYSPSFNTFNVITFSSSA